MTMTETPALPYAGTAGYSGSETSEAQVRLEAGDGTVKDRQDRALRMLTVEGRRGMTVAEFRAVTGLHHGKASSVLSTLHHDGLVARLLERRDKCAVYVRPNYVHGREVAPHGRRDPLHDYLQEWLERDEDGWSRSGRDPRGFTAGLRELTGYGAT